MANSKNPGVETVVSSSSLYSLADRDCQYRAFFLSFLFETDQDEENDDDDDDDDNDDDDDDDANTLANLCVAGVVASLL